MEGRSTELGDLGATVAAFLGARQAQKRERGRQPGARGVGLLFEAAEAPGGDAPTTPFVGDGCGAGRAGGWGRRRQVGPDVSGRARGGAWAVAWRGCWAERGKGRGELGQQLPGKSSRAENKEGEEMFIFPFYFPNKFSQKHFQIIFEFI